MTESGPSKLIVVLAVIAAVLVILFFSVLLLSLCVDIIIPRILVWIGVKKQETTRSITIVLDNGPGAAIEATDDTKL